MLVIRLTRGGAKKRPFYHIVVTDSRNRRDGRYVSRLGYFNPKAGGPEKRLHINDRAKIADWVSQGAQVSQRVKTLLKEWDQSAA